MRDEKQNGLFICYLIYIKLVLACVKLVVIPTVFYTKSSFPRLEKILHGTEISRGTEMTTSPRLEKILHGNEISPGTEMTTSPPRLEKILDGNEISPGTERIRTD